MSKRQKPPKTLADIKARCDVTDDGCWLWTGYAIGGTVPTVSMPTGKMATRRASWMLAGRGIKDGNVVYVTCGEPMCCNPDHCSTGTKKRAIRQAVKDGAFDTPAKRASVAVNLSAAGRRKLSRDQVLRVLTGGERAVDLAAEFGVKPQAISSIRTGRHYRDIRPAGDVFSMASAPGLFSRLMGV